LEHCLTAAGVCCLEWLTLDISLTEFLCEVEVVQTQLMCEELVRFPHLNAEHDLPAADKSARRQLRNISYNSSLALARLTGLPLHAVLVRDLGEAPLGPELAAACARRRREVAEALADVRGFAGKAEQSFARGNGWEKDAPRLLGALPELWQFCHHLDRALEVLEATSRACGEGAQVMAEYRELHCNAIECNIMVDLVDKRVRCVMEQHRESAWCVPDACRCPCVQREDEAAAGDDAVAFANLPTLEDEASEEADSPASCKGALAAPAKRVRFRLDAEPSGDCVADFVADWLLSSRVLLVLAYVLS